MVDHSVHAMPKLCYQTGVSAQQSVRRKRFENRTGLVRARLTSVAHFLKRPLKLLEANDLAAHLG